VRKVSNNRLQELLEDWKRLLKAMENREYEEAKSLADGLRAKSLSLGVNAPSTLWAVAAAKDNLGEVPAAFNIILKASNMDPFCPTIQQSFRIITLRLRSLLTEGTLELGEAKAAQYYNQLVAADMADLPCHLAMARHLTHAGKLTQAMKLLDSVTQLFPKSKAAWKEKAKVAAVMGDTGLVALCEAEAATLSPLGLAPRPASSPC